jgi:hypothetical protein
MDRDTEQEIIRRAYAKQIMAVFGVSDRRIEAAFASVKREIFLGRGPWQIIRWGRGYISSRAEIPCTSTTTSWSASSQSATSTMASHHCTHG